MDHYSPELTPPEMPKPAFLRPFGRYFSLKVTVTVKMTPRGRPLITIGS